jgi:leader peptidase (prepilin peptidase)/N-methyltransferase
LYIASLAFLIFIAFMLGASLASFMGVVVERVPKKETILGYSHCACGRPLKWYENVPVFGWLRVGGRTKCCDTKIPAWYFVSELITGLVFAAVATFILI